MLDEATSIQLREVFGALTSQFTLVVFASGHAQQAELLELSRALADTSPHIETVLIEESVDDLHMALHKDGVPTGVTFRGVPGGHEFTSLVLAVLHADGQGKLPDAAIRARVRSLQGPIALRTYVSLNCTTCPEVVQALNLIALLHPEISHQLVDGALCQDEVAQLGLQGVPAVFAGDRLLHVGKANFAELVQLLEQMLGQREDRSAASERVVREYDVVVIGGGPAGVSAAIYSARKGLRTAIVAEKFGGQVQDTLGIENLVGTTYTEGPRLVADLEKHVRSYPIDVLEHRRVEHLGDGPEKTLWMQGGEQIMAKSLIIATGAAWRELGVPGEKAHIGHGVAFCPHCDGPFYKGRPVAVVGGGNSGVEAALDLAGICSAVTLLEFADALKADAVLVEKLQATANVTVITSARTTEVLGESGKVVGMRYEDRTTGDLRDLSVDGIFVQIGLSPNSRLVADHVALNRNGEIVVDERGRTNVPGIYAAGDVTTAPFKQIVVALGDGAKAALAAFEDRMRAA